LNSLEIEDDYDGPHISVPPTLKDIVSLLKCFKAGGTLHLKYAMQIIQAVTKIYEDQPTVQVLPLPNGTKMTIVGDLHGQLQDLFTIFTINGLPTPTNQYFFNGDFVDRGYYGVEIVLTIFAFKLLYPNAVHMNRGNHECRQQNAYMGFEDEVLYVVSFLSLSLSLVISHMRLTRNTHTHTHTQVQVRRNRRRGYKQSMANLRCLSRSISGPSSCCNTRWKGCDFSWWSVWKTSNHVQTHQRDST
jgi:hypothetical protein